MRTELNARKQIPLLILCLGLVLGPALADVNFEIWDIDLDALPDYSTLGEPDVSGRLANFDIESLRGDADYFTFRFTGYISIETPGTYTFFTASDDGSKLYIGDWEGVGPLTEVVNNDGLHGTQEMSGTINLAAGLHGIMVTYFEKTGGDVLEVRWQGPGIAKELIPDGVLFDGLARDKFPPNGAINLPVETVLSWSDPDTALDPSPLYIVHFGTEPNLPQMEVVIDGEAVNAYDAELDYGQQYYWSVSLVDPNEGGVPSIIPGPIMGFETAPSTPVFLSNPQSVRLWAGETAVFAVDVLSAAGAPLSYAWYKQGSSSVLSSTDTLEIADAQPGDEGFYYCVAANEFGATTSQSAGLKLKKLIGHWPFDGDFEDKVGGNHGTAVGQQPVFVEGIVPLNGGQGQAVRFDGLGAPLSQAVRMSSDGVPPQSSFTLSFWEKTTSDTATGYIFASSDGVYGGGRPVGYERIYIWRRAEGEHYVGFHCGYNFEIHGAMGPATMSISRHEWHLVTFVYDYDLNRYWYYVDAENVTNPWTGYQLTVSRMEDFVADFFLGNREELGRPYMGLIDDFRIYDFAMDRADIAMLYTEAVGGYVCLEAAPNDLNGDCVVNLADLAILAADWTNCNFVPVEACN